MKMTLRKSVDVLLALLTTLACFAMPASAEDAKLSIAVSIVSQRAFVQAVAGDLADVVVMVPAGSSPGNYEPTPMEMETFSQASVYFTIGVPTESANILPQAEDMTVVDLAAIVAEQYPERTFSSGSRDPHIWLSPKRVMVMVDTIAQTLEALDPDHADVYAANAADYLASLTELDAYMTNAFNTMTKKEFVVFHPAYSYLADDYGLTMIALQKDGNEATAQELAEVIDLAKADGITTIFSQAEIDSKQPDAFAEEIGGTKVMLAPLGEDYIPNMLSMADAISASMQ